MKVCGTCGRDKPKGHICDLVTLSDDRNVHVSRIEHGGDLHDLIGKGKDDLKVTYRWITPEMREQMRKRGIGER